MKPQSFTTPGRVALALLLFSGFFALPAWASPGPPACSSSNQPTGATAYAATSPDLVSVIDASANTVACTFTVGNNPGNLVVSPDSSTLFVENDGDGTVSVVNLATAAVSTLSVTGSAMTANLAVSPDGTQLFVVTLPATLTPTTQASLYAFALPSLTPNGSNPISVVAPAPATATPVTAAGLGIAFTSDSTSAGIATEGLTYVVTTATDTITGTVNVSGGSVAIDQTGTYAYVLDTTPTGNAAVSQITISNNSVVTSAVTPACAQGNTIAVPPTTTPDTAVVYTCQSDGTIQGIDFSMGAPTTANVITIASGVHPQGIFVGSDSNHGYVGVDDGMGGGYVAAILGGGLSTTIPTGGPVRGVIQRPVVITAVSATSATVPTASTDQVMGGSVLYAFNGTTPTWNVHGVAGGSPFTGTISASGLYTAPSALPDYNGGTTADRIQTITASSVEMPLFSQAHPSVSVSATVTITPSQLVIISGSIPSAVIPAGLPIPPIAVAVEDAAGNTDLTSNGVSITITSGTTPSAPPAAALSGGLTTQTTAGGLAVFSGLTLTQVGTTPEATTLYNYTLTAAMTSGPPPALTSASTNSFTILPAIGPFVLVITTQPSTTTAGNAINPAVVVELRDQYSNLEFTNNTSMVTMAITAPGVFSGGSTLTIPVVAGVATFGNLVPTKSGIGFELIASGPAPTTLSNPFAVNPAGASTLIVAAPATATAGTPINVTVTAADSFSNIATGYTGTVHFTTSDGQAIVPGDYTFTGGDAGQRTFTAGATLKTSGSQTITGTDTVNASITGTTASITVNFAAVAKLAVTGYPSPATAGTANNFTVTAQDAFNNTVTNYADSVHFTSTDGQSVLPANSTLTNGVGTFSATLKTAGTQSITGTDSTVPGVNGTDSGITVNPAAATTLVVTGYPTTDTAGTANNVTVTAQDAFTNTATGYTGTVHFTSTDGQAALPGNSTLTNGVGTFSATLKTTGTQSITGTDTVTNTITGTESGISVGAAAASQLVFTTQPTNGTAGNALAPVTVKIEDPFGNVETGSSAAVSIGSVSVPTGAAAATGTLSVNATAGVATFSALTLTGANIPPASGSTTVTPYSYTLAASSGGLNGTSASFAIAPGAGTHLVFTTQPVGGQLGGNQAALPGVVVTVEDTLNNVATSSSAAITMALSTPANLITASGTSANPVVVNATAGVAPFTNLRISKAGAYTLSGSASGVTPATSSAFTLTDTISLSVALGSGSTSSTLTGETTAVNALPIRGTDPLVVTVNNDPNNATLGATWTASAGTITVGTCTNTSGALATCTATYTAPAIASTAGTSVTITATSVTDAGKSSSAFNVVVFPDVYTPVTPTALTIPTGSSTGSTTINIIGPTSADNVTFQLNCASFSSGLTNATCSFSLAAGSTGSVTSAGLVTPGANSTTSVVLTLGIIRSSTTAPNVNPQPSTPPTSGGRPLFTLGLALLMAMMSLLVLRRTRIFVPRNRHAYTFALLIGLLIGGASACTQFSTPATPSAPITSGSVASNGTFNVTVTPTGANAGNFTTRTISNIPVTVN